MFESEVYSSVSVTDIFEELNTDDFLPLFLKYSQTRHLKLIRPMCSPTSASLITPALSYLAVVLDVRKKGSFCVAF